MKAQSYKPITTEQPQHPRGKGLRAALNHVLFGEVLEAEPELVLEARGRLPALHQVREEDVGHLHGTLVDGCANAALR